MNKTLKEDIQEYIDFLKSDVEDLENRRNLTSRMRCEVLKSVIPSLEDMLEIDRRNENKQRFEEIRNKVRKKSYIEKRVEEITSECNINKALEEYYKLGLAGAYGYIMYMIDQDFDKKDIKKFIIDGAKDDTQFRCDLFGVWGELYDKRK